MRMYMRSPPRHDRLFRFLRTDEGSEVHEYRNGSEGANHNEYNEKTGAGRQWHGGNSYN